MKLKTNSNYIHTTTKKNELIEDVKTTLLEYLKSNAYPEAIIREIMDEDFIASNPSYYLCYPYLFNAYFQIKDKEVLNLLSVSGFLYYKAVILIDDIFDNKDSKNNFQKFFTANICQEETVKILSSFFPVNSSFWKTWNARKFEYAKAYKLDKTLTEIKDYSEFEALADYKSAFGKIAIDCLYHISEVKNKSMYLDLLESHKYFYVSFQIMDDITDYCEDFNNGQFNISRHELISRLNTESDSIENYSVVEQKKLVYLKNVAENLYERALNYLDTSLNLQSKYNPVKHDFWINEINSLYNTAVTHLQNIKGYINVYHTERKKSTVTQNPKKIKETIEFGIYYLESNQLSNGSWNDIFNDAGISDVWVTSYVTYAMENVLPCTQINIARNFTEKSKVPNGLWGYNKTWIDDADSSSFALLSLNVSENIEDHITQWLTFQNEDGGFSTYNDKDILLSSLNSPHIQNVEGWLQSHFCVSAVAYLVFAELKISSKNEFKRLRSYILKTLKSSESNLSYWWSNDIYAIYYLILGADKLNDLEILDLCEKRLEYLIGQDSEFNYFDKGLLLSSLCLTDRYFTKYSDKVRKVADQILSNQLADGSWEESYALKMPHPSVLNASSDYIKCKKGDRGTNIITKDYNRIFTTASCLKALKHYESRTS